MALCWYEVYVVESSHRDVEKCYTRGVERGKVRTKEDLQALADKWETPPPEWNRLDTKPLIDGNCCECTKPEKKERKKTEKKRAACKDEEEPQKKKKRNARVAQVSSDLSDTDEEHDGAEDKAPAVVKGGRVRKRKGNRTMKGQYVKGDSILKGEATVNSGWRVRWPDEAEDEEEDEDAGFTMAPRTRGQLEEVHVLTGLGPPKKDRTNTIPLGMDADSFAKRQKQQNLDMKVNFKRLCFGGAD